MSAVTYKDRLVSWRRKTEQGVSWYEGRMCGELRFIAGERHPQWWEDQNTPIVWAYRDVFVNEGKSLQPDTYSTFKELKEELERREQVNSFRTWAGVVRRCRDRDPALYRETWGDREPDEVIQAVAQQRKITA